MTFRERTPPKFGGALPASVVSGKGLRITILLIGVLLIFTIGRSLAPIARRSKRID